MAEMNPETVYRFHLSSLSGPLLEMWLHLKLLFSNAVALNLRALKSALSCSYNT